MNQKELKEIIELISQHQIAEFEMERAGLKLRIRTCFQPVTVHPKSVAEGMKEGYAPVVPETVGPAQVSVSHPVAPSEPPSPSTAVSQEKLFIIKAPIVGTFYRAPSPTAKSFVEIGTRVQPGTVLCIIEAMKLMNEIESEVAGEIVEIFQENGKPVEYGQQLFGIRQD